MKKILMITLALLLTFSLLTACGGNSGNGSPGGATNPPVSGGGGNHTTTDPDDYDDDDDDDDYGEPAEKPIKTPEITVNPGDVVFDNDIIKLVYTEVQLDDPDSNYPQMSIICFADKNTDKKINIHTDEQFVINGSPSGIYDPGFAQFTVSRSDYVYTFISMEQLADKGISAEDIKTVQVTFTVKDYDTDYKTDEVLFEGTALFNIELP